MSRASSFTCSGGSLHANFVHMDGCRPQVLHAHTAQVKNFSTLRHTIFRSRQFSPAAWRAAAIRSPRQKCRHTSPACTHACNAVPLISARNTLCETNERVAKVHSKLDWHVLPSRTAKAWLATADQAVHHSSELGSPAIRCASSLHVLYIRSQQSFTMGSLSCSH